MSEATNLDRRRLLFLSGLTAAGIVTRPLRALAADKEGEPGPTRRVHLRGKGLDCIEAVAFSADRTTLATAHSDGVIELWDLRNGQERKGLATEIADLGFLAFADQDRVVVFRGGNGTTGVWHPLAGTTRTVLAKEAVPRRGLTATAVSADGKLLATVRDGGGCDTLVRVRDLAGNRDVFQFNNADGHEEVYALAFAPDGKALALGDQAGAVTLLDTRTGKLGGPPKAAGGEVAALAWSADGKRLAAASRGRPPQEVAIRVWSVAAGQPGAELAGFRYPGTELLFSPDGRNLAVYEEGSDWLSVWAAAAGTKQAQFRVTGYRGAAFMPDSRTLAVVREESRIEEVLFFDLGRPTRGKPK
jgi:WD40 repeat protein